MKKRSKLLPPTEPENKKRGIPATDSPFIPSLGKENNMCQHYNNPQEVNLSEDRGTPVLDKVIAALEANNFVPQESDLSPQLVIFYEGWRIKTGFNPEFLLHIYVSRDAHKYVQVDDISEEISDFLTRDQINRARYEILMRETVRVQDLLYAAMREYEDS